MALRVLLADESSTIKKVFQLALQDYAVDVVAVNVGVDVLPVAARFKPDIVFADVLLQQRNGYEVAADIKSNPELKDLPVVLIWSGFMELDEDKFQASKADSHLEKPFDAKKLREIVQQLVPKTKTQSLSDFLTMPKMPDFAEAPGQPAPPAPAGDLETVDSGAPQEGGWNMDSFEPMAKDEDFAEVNIPKSPSADAHDIAEVVEPKEEGDNEWMQKTLTNFQLKLPKDSEDEDQLEVRYEVPEEKIEGDDFLYSEDQAQVATPEPTPHSLNEDDLLEDNPEDLELDLTPPSDREKAPLRHGAAPVLSEEELEALIRGQAKEMLETVIWRVVPELATQMIERELNRLLKERESKS